MLRNPLSNPLYFSLQTHADLTPKKTQEGMFYFLLPLEEKKEETGHLSVFEYFSSTEDVFSPIHYTVKYSSSVGPVIIHFHFDEFGEPLNTYVGLDDLAKTPVNIDNLSAEDKAAIDLMRPDAAPKLKIIFQELVAAQADAKTKKDSALAKLEEESRQGTTSNVYFILLGKTITAFNEYHQLEFYPCYAIRNSLQRHFDFLQSKKPQKKKRADKSQQTFVEAEAAEPQPTELRLPLNLSLNSRANIEPLAEEKSRSITRSTLSKKENDLYQKLNQCQNNDVNAILKINKQLDKLEETRIETIVQACIDGNLKTIVRHLREDDITLILSLVSTAAYYNHVDLFVYLYKKNKLKQLVFRSPYATSKPLTYAQVRDVSPLAIAYENRNLPFFLMLLNEYHYNPNQQDVLMGSPLLNRAIESEQDIEYVRALLKAGANPNLTSTGEIKAIFDEKLRKGSEETLKSKRITNKLADTALIVAADSRNVEGVNLSLQHGADSTWVNNEGFTAFGLAVMCQHRPLNKAIIETFLKKGHQIDERSTPVKITGLYYSCQYGNLEATKMLLGFGADPVALHKIKTLLLADTIFTPLSIAAYKNFTSIVSELLIA